MAVLVNTAKQTRNKRTLLFSLSPECTEFIEFTKPPLPASYYRKITSQELLIYHSDCISLTSFIFTHLSCPNKSQKCVVVCTAVLRFTLSSCPVLLYHSSSVLLLLFFLFPPFSSSLLPPSADNVNNPPFTAYVCLFSSLLSIPPLLTQFSPRCLIRPLAQGANERPVEGHPGPFQPRHGLTRPTG